MKITQIVGILAVASIFSAAAHAEGNRCTEIQNNLAKIEKQIELKTAGISSNKAIQNSDEDAAVLVSLESSHLLLQMRMDEDCYAPISSARGGK